MITYTYFYVVVEDPVDTTVCEGDNATFSCVVFIPSSIFPTKPGWRRNGTIVDMMRHTVTSNLTGDAPVYVNGTVTVSNITVLDDKTSYQCASGSATSTGATLNVVGE